MPIDFHHVDRLMQEGLAAHTFPGAVLLIADDSGIVFHNAYGMADLFRRQSMRCDTVFDLASLTKPLATTLAVMLLVQQGRIALDRACADYWWGFQEDGKSQITLRHLLSHCSGLPVWRPYYLRLRCIRRQIRRQVIQQWVAKETLVSVPGQKAAYSDLGFMVVQWLVEQESGMRLDRFLNDNIWKILKLDDLFFIDLEEDRPDRAYAATELCPWRSRLLWGEVHDDNAHALGGIAGHAGLFGTAEAVAKLLQGLLAADQEASVRPLFQKETVQLFFQRQPGSSWTLGFDTPAEKGSSAGALFSPATVGHLGYTGTSFWMDRQTGIIVVLLTNRVHPSRYNDAIREFRPKLHNAVMAALGVGRPDSASQ